MARRAIKPDRAGNRSRRPEHASRHARWNLTLAALLAATWTATSAHAQVLPAAKPAPAMAPGAVAKPLNPAGTRAASPGTQTEDDVYVGIKRTAPRQVQGVTPPGSGTPAPRPGAGTSPNTGVIAKKNARAGGDDELDELEIERRTVQRDNSPLAGKPQPRPGAGTSPNTGRTAAPAGLPYKF
jgi:hypothetical protein